MTSSSTTPTTEHEGLTPDNVAIMRDYIENVIVWPGQGVPAELVYVDGRSSAAEIDVRKKALRIRAEKDFITTMKPRGARLIAYDTGLSAETRAALNVMVSEGLVTEIHRSPLAA